MAIKLRNIKYHKITKLVVMLVIIASFAISMIQLQLGLQKKLNLECLIEPNYNMSTDFYTKLDEALEQVSLIAYINEDLGAVSFYYYMNAASKEYSNTGRRDRIFYEQFTRAFFYMEEGEWRSGAYSYDKTKLGHGLLKNHTAYVAFPDDYMDAKQKIWDDNRAELMPIAIIFLISLILSISLTIYSCAITGRKQGDKSVHLKSGDRSYTELLLLALAAVIWFYVNDMILVITDGISIGIKMDLYNWNIIRQITTTNTTRLIFIAVASIIFSTVFLFLLLSLVRKLKAGLLIKDSIINKLYYRLYLLFRHFFSGEINRSESLVVKLQFRQIIFLTVTIISCAAITVLASYRQRWFTLPLVLVVLIIVWYTKGNNSIYDKIDKEIKESTEEQMRSERMKVELITNVSHDLKTPLTSIISFIDLLSKEDNLSEGAKDYIKILQDKSERLKNIVMDLFDLAKSTSGNVKLEYDYIDLNKLIKQTLADMDDRIAASGLSFKCKLSENPIYIYADGNKIYRVFLNLVDNALKYAMRQTRVYIELSQNNNKAEVSVKNIAGYDMNFTAQEILQRFTRGDQARTSEGSGLGLSIAESFTRICGGDFRVEVEGDMFKVYLSFDLVAILDNPKPEISIEASSQG